MDRYRKLYPKTRLEIIVVDDGSPDKAVIDPGEYPWPVNVIRLPDKAEAKNPCVAFNVGVKATKADIILLTNPEVVHRTPILVLMRDELRLMGRKGYIAAACWGKGMWYCHSTDEPPDEKVGRAKRPSGSGFHFCSMLHRSLYEEVGGFSEEYRDGQAYEDNDFLWKLHKAGAVFSIKDDLVTEHLSCPRTIWPKGGAERNRAIFEAKWNA